jgi:hypothetical protein
MTKLSKLFNMFEINKYQQTLKLIYFEGTKAEIQEKFNQLFFQNDNKFIKSHLLKTEKNLYILFIVYKES